MKRCRKKTVMKATALFIFPFMLTGCWDSVEINERYPILEFAIDKNQITDNGAIPEERERYLVTYSIPDMSKLSGSESLLEDVKNIIAVKSPSVLASVDKLQTMSQNTITFSHAKALILGEELIKDQKLFKGALDSVTRKTLIARNTPIFATMETAGKVLETENPQNPIIGLYIMKFFNNKERSVSYAQPQLLGNFIKEMEDTGISTLPQISVSKDKQVEISGGALFKDYELIKWLNKEEVRGQMLIAGKVSQAPIIIVYKDEYLTYLVKREKSRMKFEEKDGKMTCEIELSFKGNISEYVSESGQNIFDKDSIEEVQKLIEEEIVRQAEVALKVSKEYNIDFLNIGKNFYRKHPYKWKDYEQDWEITGYKDFPIEITAEVDIEGTGTLE